MLTSTSTPSARRRLVVHAWTLRTVETFMDELVDVVDLLLSELVDLFRSTSQWYALMFNITLVLLAAVASDAVEILYGTAWKGPHAEQNVLDALALGYRAFDTANVYAASYNETAVGVAPKWSAGNSPSGSRPSEKRPWTARWMHARVSTVTATSKASGAGPPKSSL